MPAISQKKNLVKLFVSTVKDLAHISGTVGVSFSVGITRQVAHGTLLIFGDGLLF